jgi:hypothetical protein
VPEPAHCKTQHRHTLAYRKRTMNSLLYACVCVCRHCLAFQLLLHTHIHTHTHLDVYVLPGFPVVAAQALLAAVLAALEPSVTLHTPSTPHHHPLLPPRRAAAARCSAVQRSVAAHTLHKDAATCAFCEYHFMLRYNILGLFVDD